MTKVTEPSAGRARPLSPDERRRALIAATLEAVHEHGCRPSTRQIAASAGVAEGTIFRVFDNKDELIEAAVQRAFDPTRLSETVARIDRELPVRGRLTAMAEAFQEYFQRIFELMEALQMTAPPSDHSCPSDRPDPHARLEEELLDLLRPDADALRVPPERLVAYLRILAFGGSHSGISRGNPLTPEEISGLLLDGVLTTTKES